MKLLAPKSKVFDDPLLGLDYASVWPSCKVLSGNQELDACRQVSRALSMHLHGLGEICGINDVFT